MMLTNVPPQKILKAGPKNPTEKSQNPISSLYGRRCGHKIVSFMMRLLFAHPVPLWYRAAQNNSLGPMHEWMNIKGK